MRALEARGLLCAFGLLVLAVILPVAPASAAARPDLAALSVSGPPAHKLFDGAAFTARVRVTNRGRRTAKASRVVFYAVAAGKRRTLGRARARRLRPGRTARLQRRIVLHGLAARSYRLLACADARHRLRERSERNNCRRAGHPLRVALHLPLGPAGPDTMPPRVTLDAPAAGSTSDDQTPLLSGSAGDAAGDGATAAVVIYSGSDTSSSAVQQLSAPRTGSGWSVRAATLPVGTYTAVATQRDAAGNVGRASSTFNVPAVLLAAGDIASCLQDGDTQTASILSANPSDLVAALGDNAYESGSTTNYTDCYDPTWGVAKAKTRPAPGNHEYNTSGAAGYFGYFGAIAGTPGEGWYSYDLGAWHVIVLNSSDGCSPVSCASGSPQEQWLHADLVAHSNQCTLAYWHHPLFSSGSVGGAGATPAVKPLWDDLYAAGADVVLNGHSHIYERFAPQDPDAAATPGGIREFIVGTGGYLEHTANDPAANVEALNNDTFGVLRLVLRPDRYSWQFLPVAGKTFTDSGSAACH